MFAASQVAHSNEDGVAGAGSGQQLCEAAAMTASRDVGQMESVTPHCGQYVS